MSMLTLARQLNVTLFNVYQVGGLSVKYRDLRDFMSQLERAGELKRVTAPVATDLEITEISDRILRREGPALLFEHPMHKGSKAGMPVLANLFGTPRRVAWGMGADDVAALRETGELLASLREPEPPRGFRDALAKVAMLKAALWDMNPKTIKSAPCQEIVLEGNDVDLRSEEHTSELQSLMRISYAVFCLKKKKNII